MEAMDVSDSVEVTGLVANNDLERYFLSMNVFVISSDHEGLPNTLLEAASYGVPIIATAVDGIKDVVKDGVNALLVPPKDPPAMSNAIASVLSDQALAERLSKGALEMAQRCTYEAEKSSWFEIYENCLKQTA
jgi:glycosyltransferase involved in cell wall biosynthesis